MSGESLSREEILSLFEGARWAPSFYNEQPWRFLYATRESEHWQCFFDLMVEGNQRWAANAAMLVVVVSRETTGGGDPYPTHSYDTGAAWHGLALQGTKLGLVVHGMAGFDYEAARRELAIPDGYRVEAMIAVGRPGWVEDLHERFRPREQPSDRLPVDDFAFEGPFRR